VLHKIDKIRGFHILAADGEIGHVDEFLVGRARLERSLPGGRYQQLDRRSIGASSRARWSDAIDSPNRKIRVRLTRDEIKRGPSVDTADIETIETLPAVWIM
jgi:hypothetical protein